MQLVRVLFVLFSQTTGAHMDLCLADGKLGRGQVLEPELVEVTAPRIRRAVREF